MVDCSNDGRAGLTVIVFGSFAPAVDTTAAADHNSD